MFQRLRTHRILAPPGGLHGCAPHTKLDCTSESAVGKKVNNYEKSHDIFIYEYLRVANLICFIKPLLKNIHFYNLVFAILPNVMNDVFNNIQITYLETDNI